MGLVVSYHCGGEYKAEAQRLVESLKASCPGLEYLIVELPDRGSWRANVFAKAEVILGVRRSMPFTDILFVDADTVIHEDPFPALEDDEQLGDCDIAVHHFQGRECCSGTVWMPWNTLRTGLGDSLLKRWIELNEQATDSNTPIRQPQTLLAQALGEAAGELEIGELPASHCYIFDLSKQAYPNAKPVIEHLQASRDYRTDRQIDCPNGPRAARIQEIQAAGEREEVRGEDGDGDPNLRIVGFYTLGSQYEQEAARLRTSMRRVGLRCYTYGVHPAGDWDSNVAMKQDFIRNELNLMEGPVLYIDVDAVVHENCEEYFLGLARAGVDFAAHWFQGPAGGYDQNKNDDHFLSGTMFFGDTPGARALLAAWDEENKKQIAAGNVQGQGQKNLQTVLDEGRVAGLNVHRLPGRYCRVFDKPWAYPDDEPNIIEHLIASRENRGESAGKINEARQIRIQQIDAEMASAMETAT